MRWMAILLATTTLAQAEALVATHTIRAQTILTEADLQITDANIAGAISDLDAAIGLETRITLYAGRPIRLDDLGAPAIIDRNQIVTLGYLGTYLSIQTEGRALARGGVGDIIHVMNLNSRSTVTGRILADGSVSVSP